MSVGRGSGELKWEIQWDDKAEIENWNPKSK